MLRCRPTGRNKTFIYAIWVFYFGSVSTALWTSRGQGSIGTHWWHSVSFAGTPSCVFRLNHTCVLERQHCAEPNTGNSQVSKSTVHLAWFTHNLHDMTCEVWVWDERWGSSRSVRISSWSERSFCRRSTLKSPASGPEIDRNLGSELGPTGYTQPVNKCRWCLTSPSIIQTPFPLTASICCLSAAAVSSALGKWPQMPGID